MFSLVGYLQLPHFCIISFLRFLFMKGARFSLIIFDCEGACFSNVLEIRLLVCHKYPLLQIYPLAFEF